MIEIDFIPTRLGLFNTVKSEKEIEYNIDMIRVPETPSNIFTFADGGIGYICNGEIAQAVRSVNYTDENPTFDIYSIENIKKTGRFKENARLNKTLDNEFKSKINSKTEIKVTLLKNDIQLNSESELHTELFKYLQTKHHLLNIKGGSFMPDWDNRNDLPERMYTAETTWSEMSAETTRNEETKNEYVRRQVTVNNMKRRFSSSMNISGYEITHDGIKYSSSVANRIGRELTCKEGKTLDSETLDNMSVQQAVNLDMLHSMTKSIIVDRNNKIDKENRRMKGIIDFFFKADDGKAIKFDLLKDKEKYFINKLNNLIRKYIKSCGDRLNDVDLERLKNAIKIKDVDTKLVMIKGYIECTKLDLEEMYSNAVEKANIVINEIQNYKFANTLCMRYKERLYRIAEEYRKATGRLLEIQNFKVQITELNKEIILDNKNAIKQLNKEDRELKKLLREENKHLSRINRALNRNKLTDTMFRDYITEKTEIKIKEECNILLNISSKIINSDIQNKIEYDITKQIKLQTQLNHILDGLYEIQDGVEYSLDLLKLTNNITNINRDMFYDKYRNYVCA